MVGRRLGQNTSRFRNRQRLAENTPKGLKPGTDKWDGLKLKFLHSKRNHPKEETAYRMGGNFAGYTSDMSNPSNNQ